MPSTQACLIEAPSLPIMHPDAVKSMVFMMDEQPLLVVLLGVDKVWLHAVRK